MAALANKNPWLLRIIPLPISKPVKDNFVPEIII
jgi:hypothetical protein